MLYYESLVYAGPWFCSEHKPLANRMQRTIECRDCGVGSGPLKFGDGGLTHSQPAGETRLCEVGSPASFSEQHSRIHTLIITYK